MHPKTDLAQLPVRAEPPSWRALDLEAGRIEGGIVQPAVGMGSAKPAGLTHEDQRVLYLPVSRSLDDPPQPTPASLVTGLPIACRATSDGSWSHGRLTAVAWNEKRSGVVLVDSDTGGTWDLGTVDWILVPALPVGVRRALALAEELIERMVNEPGFTPRGEIEINLGDGWRGIVALRRAVPAHVGGDRRDE